MTGIGDKLDRLLEEMGAVQEALQNQQTDLNELRKELKPVFFQANVIRFLVKLAPWVAGIAGGIGAALPFLSKVHL